MADPVVNMYRQAGLSGLAHAMDGHATLQEENMEGEWPRGSRRFATGRSQLTFRSRAAAARALPCDARVADEADSSDPISTAFRAGADDEVDIDWEVTELDIPKLVAEMQRNPHVRRLSIGGIGEGAASLIAQAVDEHLPNLEELSGVELGTQSKALALPDELVETGNNEILNFLRTRKAPGRGTMSVAKVIFLGAEDCGKTSVVAALAHTGAAPVTGRGGVKITEMPVKQTQDAVETSTASFLQFVQLVSTAGSGDDTNLSGLLLYDLMGADHFLAMHRTFMRHAVYAVCATGSRPEDFAAYANTALQVQPDAKLVFVGTGRAPMHDAKVTLRSAYGSCFAGYVHLGSRGSGGPDRLRALLIDTCANLPQVRTALPDAYETLAQAIEAARQDKSRSVLSLAEWEDMVLRAGIAPYACTKALDLFDSCGGVLTLPGGDGVDVILRPQELADALAAALNAPEAIVPSGELAAAWESSDIDFQRHQERIFEGADVAFSVCALERSGDVRPSANTLVPALLGQSSAPHEKLGAFQAEGAALAAKPIFVAHLTDLPDALWSALIVRLRQVLALGGWSSTAAAVVTANQPVGSRLQLTAYGIVEREERCVRVETWGSYLLHDRVLQALAKVLAVHFPGIRCAKIELLSPPEALAQSRFVFNEEDQNSEGELTEEFRPVFIEGLHWLSTIREAAPALEKNPVLRFGRNVPSHVKYLQNLLKTGKKDRASLQYAFLKKQSYILSLCGTKAIWLVYGSVAYPLRQRIAENFVLDLESGVEVPGTRIANPMANGLTMFMRTALKALGVQGPSEDVAFSRAIGKEDEPSFIAALTHRTDMLYSEVFHVELGALFLHFADVEDVQMSKQIN